MRIKGGRRTEKIRPPSGIVPHQSIVMKLRLTGFESCKPFVIRLWWRISPPSSEDGGPPSDKQLVSVFHII